MRKDAVFFLNLSFARGSLIASSSRVPNLSTADVYVQVKKSKN